MLRLIKWTVKSGLFHSSFIVNSSSSLKIKLAQISNQRDEHIYFTKQYILRNLFELALQWPLNAFQIDQPELFADIIHNQIFYVLISIQNKKIVNNNNSSNVN